MSNISWLGANDAFPNPLYQPDPDPNVPGLIAVSERIYPGQLASAYQLGIFPWYSEKSSQVHKLLMQSVKYKQWLHQPLKWVL